jgi:UDP-N-acetylmuramyl tripeptide synthase
MAATKTLRRREVPGATSEQSLDLTGDAAYPTGGYILLPADFQFSVLRRIASAFFSTVAGAAFELAIVPTYNADNTLAQVAVALVVGTTGAQVANGVNVSTVGITLVAEGN